MSYAEIILPLPLDGYFTYGIPDTLAERVAVGMRVLCPLGKSKKYIGIVANITGTKPDFEVKDIIDVLDVVFGTRQAAASLAVAGRVLPFAYR